MMETASSISEVRRQVAVARARGQTIGLVPTMGALHEGHLALVGRAAQDCYVVVSIFVNPTQFGPKENYQAYPRDLEADTAKAKGAGADLLFLPSVEEMYPEGDSTWVEVTGLTDHLCGPHRPGHFRGVTTVVAKLFNIVQPDRAYFGEKDYQQLQVIKRMVRDLHLPIEVIGVPTVRDADGLALSSRNAYLSPEERKAALALNRALQHAAAMVARGQTDGAALVAAAREAIEAAPLVRLQYLELVHTDTLQPVSAVDSEAVLAAAAFVGNTRLIDNLRLRRG